MANKSKYYKLDDIGYIGIQKENSATEKYHAQKTAAIFKSAINGKVQERKKKA